MIALDLFNNLKDLNKAIEIINIIGSKYSCIKGHRNTDINKK
tara:strand:- start:116 stop:241 length:126 start_codon:yes stop_codon:yes gene_type:complete